MADDEHLNILRQGVRVWNRWRIENRHLFPSLSGANLTGADLTDANLTGAYLGHANLTGANLTDAILTSATLTGADLTEAFLERAGLTRASLTDANLTDANLTGAKLEYADLWNANLTGANLTGADLMNTNLRRADLTRANFTGADLRAADLRAADLTEAAFAGALVDEQTLGLNRLSQLQRSNLSQPQESETKILLEQFDLPPVLVTSSTPIGRTVLMTTTFIGLPEKLHNRPIEIDKLCDWIDATAITTIWSGALAEEYEDAVRQFLKQIISEMTTTEDATEQALEAAVTILETTGVIAVQSPAKGLTMAILAGASLGAALIQFPIGDEVVPMIIGGVVGGIFMIFMRSLDAFGQSFGEAAGRVAGESAGKAMFGGEQIGLELWRKLKMRPGESDLPETPKLSEAIEKRLPHDSNSVDE